MHRTSESGDKHEKEANLRNASFQVELDCCVPDDFIVLCDAVIRKDSLVRKARKAAALRHEWYAAT